MMRVLDQSEWLNTWKEATFPGVRDLMRRPELEGAHACHCGKRIPIDRGRCARCSHVWWNLADGPAWAETIELDQWKEERMKTEARRLHKRLVEQGFEVTRVSSGNAFRWDVTNPNNGSTTTVRIYPENIDSTPRHLKNVLADLIRIGYEADHEKWRRKERERKQIAQMRAEEEARKERATDEEKAEEHLKEMLLNPPKEQAPRAAQQPWQGADGRWHCHICTWVSTNDHKPAVFVHCKRIHGWELTPEQKKANQQATKQRANERYRAAKAGKPVPPVRPTTPQPHPEPVMSPTTGRPAATPVVRKRIPDEELSAVARVRKVHERIQASAALLAEDSGKLVALFQEQHEELHDIKERMAKLEKKLAGLVDLL